MIYAPRPTFEHVTNRRARAVSSPLEDPQRRRRMVWDSVLRVFELVWTETFEGEMRALRRAFADSLYGVLLVDYLPYGAVSTIRVAFAAEQPISIEQLGPNSWAMRATLEEVR